MFSTFSTAWLLAGLAFNPLAAARPSPVQPLIQSRGPGACHTPENRQCWSEGFGINTDYDAEVPQGSLKKFYLEATEHKNWVGPDGYVKESALLFNGTFPGPKIEADWGDTIEVTVLNKMDINGTSVHWHGMRQMGTWASDGVNGITECPIQPGTTRTYRFEARQYGTTWYHSHYSATYADGLFGPLVINGPASANYDIDLGPYPISDYYYNTSFAMVDHELHDDGIIQNSNNILFNGTNISPHDASQGEYDEVILTPGKSHRLRLINPSTETSYRFSIDNHDLTVISNDLVPIVPQVTDSVFLGVGQRIDVIINATETFVKNGADNNYWMKVWVNQKCGSISDNEQPAAILRYDGAQKALPAGSPAAPSNDYDCIDDHSYEPFLSWGDIPSANFDPQIFDITFNENDDVLWHVNGTDLKVDWSDPIVEQVLEGTTDKALVAQNPHNNIYLVDGDDDDWHFFLVKNHIGAPHPIHLHGHDFVVLGASPPVPGADEVAPFDPVADKDKLNWNNPMRRDTAMVSAWGWMVFGFKSDNPGTWLIHCHIAMHVSLGLGATVVERLDEQLALVQGMGSEINSQCDAWRKWEKEHNIFEEDSGAFM